MKALSTLGICPVLPEALAVPGARDCIRSRQAAHGKEREHVKIRRFHRRNHMRKSGPALAAALSVAIALSVASPVLAAETDTGVTPIPAATPTISEQGSVPSPARAGAAWTDSTILGSIQYDTPIRRQDDFYSAVNQKWLTNTPIASGAEEASSAADLTAAVQAEKMSLLQNTSLAASDHDAQLTQTLYQLLLDWDTRNALGIEPLRPFVAAIQGVGSLDGLTAFLCDDAQNLVGNGFTEISISQYINNPEYYVVEIAPTSLLLSDSADYQTISSSGKQELSLAQSEAYYMLGRLGFPPLEQEEIFNGCLSFETELAKDMDSDKVKSADDYYSVTSNKPCTLEDLQREAGGYPIIPILQARGLAASLVYNLPEPGWLEGMGRLYTAEHLEQMKDYLLVHTLIPAMELTDRKALDAMIELSHDASGVSRSLEPSAIAYHYVEALLPEPLDNMYVRACTSGKQKAAVTAVVSDITAHYRNMLEQEPWLSASTKAEALNKLDHLTIRVAYPDELPDYSGLALQDGAHGGNLIQAFQAIQSFRREQTASLVNQRFDDSHWAMTASTVNCYYNPRDNSINILAGMLHAPFYYDGMSDEEMLAGIGFIIGHEISHAFDADGAAYDEKGELRSWWSPEDTTAFAARRERLIAYYNSIVPVQGFGHVNGQSIASEAIADLGSMKCMLEIAAEDPDFDYDRFFSYFAGCWAAVRDEMTELRYLRQDEHPLYYLRVNVTLQQFDRFCETYGITEGDGMWLAPGDRIAVW